MIEERLPEAPLDFEERSHLYKYHGVTLPSVTQIMKPMSGMLYDNVANDILMAASNRGTRVHEQISNFVLYGIAETDSDTDKYVSAYMRFNDDVNPKFVDSEYRTYHKLLRYAGTIDLVGYIEPDDGTGVDVIDLKTTATFHPVLLGAQLGAYAQALESHGIKTRKLYGLQLLKSGKYRLERVDDGFKNFLHCLAIYNAMAAEMK